jgi:hypothetical protein
VSPMDEDANPSDEAALAGAARGRFDGSSVQIFLRRLGALDFVNTSVLFGAAVLTAVLPFIILVSSLANQRIDTDLSRHIGLNRQGALIVSQLFVSSFSPAIISDSRLYGTIGVVFSLIIWFIAIGALIVLGAVAGETWNQRRSRTLMR